jgi:aminoglycoside/choline kinase family phosphotransferase
MQQPRHTIQAFIDLNCPQATVTPMAGDASTRVFYRLSLPDGNTRVLMDYGAAFTDTTDDVVLTGIFRDAGLPVPEILKVDANAGCLLLEDLGGTTLEAALQDPATDSRRATGLLQQAVQLAAEVGLKGSPLLRSSARAAEPALDAERFRYEMDFFLTHYAGDLLGQAEHSDGLRPHLHALAERAATCSRQVMCHRDFHSRNLVVLAGGGLGMVDIQDARWGPDCYDLASVLFDAYIDIDEKTFEPLIRHFLATATHIDDRAAFRERLLIVATQRVIKALGTFGYQIAILKRSQYRSAIPRPLHRLQQLLPECAPDLLIALKSADLLKHPEI